MRPAVVEYVARMLKKHAQLFRAPILETCAGSSYDVQKLFSTMKYVRQDLVEGSDTDVACDICEMPFEEKSFPTVFNFESLEHISNPFKAIDEITRVLAARGMLVLTTVMCWPLHRHPLDCWRFLPDGVKVLLEGKYEIINMEVEGLPYNFAFEDIDKLRGKIHRGIFITAQKILKE